jgi:flagellar biosynthesis GTPase FlhF
MNVMNDELLYQYLIVGVFGVVINGVLLCSCLGNFTDKDLLDEPQENKQEDTNQEEKEDSSNTEEDNFNQEEDNFNQEEDNFNQEEDNFNQEEDNFNQDEDNFNQEEDNINQEENNINQEATSSNDIDNSIIYKAFNLMTRKQLIRFVGKEHTYKNKKDLIYIAINKFILISINRIDNLPVFVKNFIKNNKDLI